MTRDPDDADGTQPDKMIERLLYEVKRVIVGQDVLLERLVVALLAGGHVLVEGVPGIAKTLAIKTVAGAVDGGFQRVQFTPDLVPADIVGTRVFDQHSGEFGTSLGPVFTNLLLADEINRAPAKVQSALLEVMQERQVTLGRDTHEVPDPFLVMATQNPIESEGTYPLPEAQLDRFMFHVLVDYPRLTEEFVIVDRVLREPPSIEPVMQLDDLRRLQGEVLEVYVDPALAEYAVRLVAATRDLASVGLDHHHRHVAFGASPRASINMVVAARALALIRGRRYVTLADVVALAPDVLRHRIVRSYEALADDVDVAVLIDAVMQAVETPDMPLAGPLGT